MKNLTAAVITVRHEDLPIWSDESYYKRKCPVCEEGLLLVARDSDTGLLQEHDRCVLCGQHVRYEDINEMRAREGL